MSDRKRKAPFSNFEKALLRELVAEKIDIIECKKTDSEQSRKKVETWQKICSNYNANPQCQPATVDQLKKLWLNMKSKARDAKTVLKQRCHTGGGPYIPDPHPEVDAVLEIIPQILPTIKVSQDSDGFGDQDGHEDDNSWLPLKSRKENQPEYDCLPTTPNRNTTDHTYTLTTVTVPSSHTTSTTTNTLNSTTETVQAQLPTIHTSATTTAAKKKITTPNRRIYNSTPNIDQLKCTLIENDIKQRQMIFQTDMENQKRMSQLEYDILLLEYQHKKKLFELIEKEQENRMKNNNNND